MTLITGTLQQAAPRQVAKKDGTGMWTFYDLTIDGKKYQTSQDVFNVAIGYLGQPILSEVENAPRNGYDNWKALSCLPASSTAQTATQGPGNAATQAIQAAQAAQAQGPVKTQAEKDKDTMIIRQTACKAVGALLSGSGVGVDLFIDVAAKVATWMETGVKPSEVSVVNTLVSELDAQAQFDADVPF